MLPAALMLAASFLTAGAAVTVTRNVLPGATSWPGTPILGTVTNPSVEAMVSETFTSGGGCTNYSQTRSVSSSVTLTRLDIHAGSRSNSRMTLRVFDLGETQTSPYTPRTDLFGSGAGLSFSYSSQSPGVLQFDFSGADQVSLTAGHIYALELWMPTSGGAAGNINWARAGAVATDGQMEGSHDFTIARLTLASLDLAGDAPRTASLRLMLYPSPRL